ncbi:hypoxanthine phosphoribosyltransferase [Basidiobolus meristosporus CBS 931.73]|uniref:Hypoxanthine phosphoribosyltransferase n=1 Tax=Basidiobolus meristosporus CBS 931.73 TaxID=1314790 RepID=A0A1Y1YPF6_9FUNG|nr:hypoxanthine phosphoribosyltransferase [Basidiobolus meristosporus CBS 931.73]|eukprot:ORX99920.1 hypoxanthine phosphoribosyltransferase [Basidiobolus meristosporus CBS 931.73]
MDAKQWIDIDISRVYPLDHFVVPQHYEKDVESILIPHGMIKDRIQKLAKLIVNNIPDDPVPNLVVCCVLKGGHQYFADLVNEIKRCHTDKGKSIKLSLEFLKVKSYENDQSTGSVRISMTEKELEEFRGKNLLIVEDIIDTGRTMVKLLERLKDFGPASVKVTSLLIKKTPLSNGYIPDYVGFAIPDAFVVGYALDYNEHFRDLDHIAVISEHGKKAYAL